MIRQEKRRLTREYQKEIDKLIKSSDAVYKKNRDLHELMEDYIDALKKKECANKKLQAYYDFMEATSQRIFLLNYKIKEINGTK